MPPRLSDNDKRELHPSPPPAVVALLLGTATYHGVSKHKANPRLFDLPPYLKQRGDETLCDEHAGFSPDKMASVGILVMRGIRAGLISLVERHGIPTIIWTIADNGWIFEARITNVGQADYHGYPVRHSEAIAEMVYRRFAEWVHERGSKTEKAAAEACRIMYEF